MPSESVQQLDSHLSIEVELTADQWLGITRRLAELGRAKVRIERTVAKNGFTHTYATIGEETYHASKKGRCQLLDELELPADLEEGG